MKMKYKVLASAVLMSLLTSNAFAREFFISGTGSDTAGDGSSGNPYRQPSKVTTMVAPGDIVTVGNGQYNGFSLSVSGTGTASNQIITWRAAAGAHPEVVITKTSGRWQGISLNADYQVIDGFTLTGSNVSVTDSTTLANAEADHNARVANPTGYGGSGEFNANGIAAGGPGNRHHITVRNCIVRKFPGGGIALVGDYFTVENNKIYNNSWYSSYGTSGATIFTSFNFNSGTGYRNKFSNNIMWNNRGLVKWFDKTSRQDVYSDGEGFILDISNSGYTGSTLVANNLAVGNGGGGVIAYKGRNADFFNNTAYLNGDKVNYADIYARESVNVRLMNNIVYARAGASVNNNIGNTNVQYDYNIYYDGDTTVNVASGTQGTHDLVANPRFNALTLTPCTEDSGSPTVTCGTSFQLAGNSPGIDGGTLIAGKTPTADLIGVTRPAGVAPYIRVGSGVDIGAYEYNIAARIPTASTTVNGRVNQALSFQIVAYNYPKQYGTTTLPAGLSLNTTTGLISGTPTSAAQGTRTVTISATNAVGQGTASVTFVIAP